ncbi:MAG TPA: hypothetical protein VL094_12305 [Sphingomonadaceae bacterium]|nr:hypothetical protein [Sphingomonadaceae bacterium]
MSEAYPDVPGGVKIMAAIGHVCLQWARLEMALLAVIYTIEGVPMEKGELIYGGLDIIPRVNMAVRLAEYHRLPQPLKKRLINARKQLQNDLSERRNQIVHGAHRDADDDTTTLTMVRWRGEKRDKTFTALDVHTVGTEIFELANDLWLWIDDYGKWKFPGHGHENSFRDLIQAGPGPRLKGTKNLYTRIQHLWRKLKG